jgi:hypothetical protein
MGPWKTSAQRGSWTLGFPPVENRTQIWMSGLSAGKRGFRRGDYCVPQARRGLRKLA